MIIHTIYRKLSQFRAIYCRHGGGSELTVVVEPKVPTNDEIICLVFTVPMGSKHILLGIY